MKTTFETTIYRLADCSEVVELEIPVYCKLETYKGTNKSDDPSEINILSCTVTETITYENRIQFLKDQKLELDDNEREQIVENFLSKQS